MKSLYYLSLFYSCLIQWLNCNSKEEAHLKRNTETINFLLSKFQTNSIGCESISYPSFSFSFGKLNFYPPITSDMTIVPSTGLKNQITVSNYILTFVFNLTVLIKDTAKVLQENYFIIEVNVTNSTFLTGPSLKDQMKFLAFNSFLISYSDKRNFLVSKRFAREFEEDHPTKGQFNNMIKNTITSYTQLLENYNYQQIDFLNINKRLQNLEKTIHEEINSTLTLENYLYYSYTIPDSKVFDGTLDAKGYNIEIRYWLIINGVKDTAPKTLQIKLPLLSFSYGFIQFSFPKYSQDNQIAEVNSKLFEEFKKNFMEKNNAYFATLKLD